MTKEARLRLMASMIARGSSVLDVGCADGALLARLRDQQEVDGRGIEIRPKQVAKAVARGLSVVQGDAAHDLAVFPDNSVDYAILSEALQAMQRPVDVLQQLLRIGRQAIVSFPNFAHWRVRSYLLLRGEMPVTPGLPSSWHDTQNIHLCTISDFRTLARTLDIPIAAEAFLAGEQPVHFWPNLRADWALFRLSHK